MSDRPSAKGLSLQSEEPSPAPPGRGAAVLVLLAFLLVVLAGVGFVGYQVQRRLNAVDGPLARLSARADEADALSRQATERATAAEAAARAAAEGRQSAEAETARAHEEAVAARSETMAARSETEAAQKEAAGEREKAARAQAEADRIRKEAEAELNRLQTALSRVAETRRTALGLVMNLGGDHLKFAFDKADLRPQDKELLSRIAGILLTSPDYTISVNGYTDDIGTDEYNQKLSERRAQAVRDYLVEAGLSPEILTVIGHGKSHPLVPGTSEEARAKNRRVELGIVNTRILYGREAQAASKEPPP
jgi:outer membrane protein OmpA-like peptidoglycan-associated protein